jgi:tRNA A-37 threonylcarbamoyl transferase component Bud32
VSDLIGHDVGRYHIVERLGAGGMATVYRAYDARLERDVAIKFIRSDIIKDELFLKRFEREAKALARLSHPNIVKVLDYGEHEGSPFLVMEFIRGDTLKSKVGRPIPWREAAHMLVPIAEALGYTHKQNIIHRDVKPSNFLVSESGHLMLSDFGIAKMLDTPDAVQLTGTGVGIGTPEYMAPEQGLGQPTDQRADIYSLGIIFYEMVTGQKPYRADTPMAVMYKQISDPLPPPRQYVPGLPDAVEKVIYKALAKKPEDRYQEMGAFTKALQSLAETPQETATRVTTPQTMAAQTVMRPTTPPITQQPVYRQAPAATAQPEAWGEAPAEPKKKSSRTWVTCGVIALVVFCIGAVIVAAVTGGFGALIAFFGPAPEGLAIEISAPPTVEMGREFEVVVVLSNQSNAEIKVTEIQVPQALLDVATVTGTAPLSTGSTSYSVGPSTGYFFDLPLAPGGSTEVRFRFQPIKTADVTAGWDVMVGTRSKRADLRVVVVEAVALEPTFTPVPPTPVPPTDVPPTPVPPTDVPPTPATDWVFVWEDDFSDPTSGFYVKSDADSSYEYKNGEYLIESRKTNWSVWVYLGYSYSNVQISVDTRVDNPTGNSSYGLICRYQNEGEFYGFAFSEDGYYTIWLRMNDEYTYLVDWTYDDRLVGVKTRRMTITCDSDLLMLELDGEMLAQARDSALTTGDVGLLVESYDTSGARTAFDNFALYEK